MRSSIASLALALVASTVACSALSEDADSADDSLKISPTGTETMSTLIVELPTGTCMPGGSCARPLAVSPNISLDGAAMTIGSPLRVAPGDHTLVVSGTSKTVNLVAGATRTIVVPVVKKECTNASGSTLPETHFGRVPALRNATCPSAATIDGKPLYDANLDAPSLQVFSGANCSGTYLYELTRTYPCSGLSAGGYTARSVRANSVCTNVTARDWKAFCEAYVRDGAVGIANTVPLTGDTAVVPGTYGFPLENGSGGSTNETRAVAEGDVKTLSFTLPLIGTIPDLFATNIKLEDPRELPDAVATTIASSRCPERSYTIPANASGTLALKAFKFAECDYTLTAAGRTVALNQNASNDVSLHRIDVDDVEVTREDGSKYTTRGTYEVYFGGNRVAGPFPTKTGIDALGGAYEVVVKYDTAEGPKTNHYNVRF
jgi:hypothetical protein